MAVDETTPRVVLAALRFLTHAAPGLAQVTGPDMRQVGARVRADWREPWQGLQEVRRRAGSCVAVLSGGAVPGLTGGSVNRSAATAGKGRGVQAHRVDAGARSLHDAGVEELVLCAALCGRADARQLSVGAV